MARVPDLALAVATPLPTTDLEPIRYLVNQQDNPAPVNKIIKEFGFRTHLDKMPSQRMVLIQNLPTVFTPSQMMLHIPAQLCLQIVRVDVARCYCRECRKTGAYSTTMALELGSAQAARFLFRWLVHGNLSDLDAAQARPIAFSEPIANTNCRVARDIEVSVVPSISRLVAAEDCVLISRYTTRFVGILALAIDSIHLVDQIARKNRAIRARLDLASMSYHGEFPSIRAADIFLCEVTRARAAFCPDMFANICFESKPPRCFDPAIPTIRVLPSYIQAYFESEFTILGQGGAGIQSAPARPPPCTLPPFRGGGGGGGPVAVADTDAEAPPPPAAPAVPNPLKPRTYMTREEFASQAAFERRLVPYDVVDVDSEVKRGIKARIRCKRVPWGHSYSMADFNKLIELKFIDSGDAFWSAVLDDMYSSQGTINLRRLRLGREPVAANMWGILH